MRGSPRLYLIKDGPQKITDFDYFAGRILYIPMIADEADSYLVPISRNVSKLRYCARVYQQHDQCWELKFRLPYERGDWDPISFTANKRGLILLQSMVLYSNHMKTYKVPCYTNFWLAYAWALRHFKE